MSSSPTPRQDLISQLRDLGITERTAKFALSQCNNNVERAAEYVFSGQADKDEVSDNRVYKSSPLCLHPVPEGQDTTGPVPSNPIERFISPAQSSNLVASASGDAGGIITPRGVIIERAVGRRNTIDSESSEGIAGRRGSLTSKIWRTGKWAAGSVGGRMRTASGDSVMSRLSGMTEGSGLSDPSENVVHPIGVKTESEISEQSENYENGPQEGNDGNGIRMENCDSIPKLSSTLSPSPSQSSFSTSPKLSRSHRVHRYRLSRPIPTLPSPSSKNDVLLTKGIGSGSRNDRDPQTSNLIMTALGRSGGNTNSSSARPSSPLGKSTGGALAALGLRAAVVANPISPPRVADSNLSTSPKGSSPANGASTTTVNITAPASTSSSRTFLSSSKPVGGASGGQSRSGRSHRSPSPFFRARRSREEKRARDKSPEVKALRTEGAESDGESVGTPGARKFRPQASAYEDGEESGTEAEVEGEETEEESEQEEDQGGEDWTEDFFDEETEKNTEANAFFYEGDGSGLGGRAADGVVDRLGTMPEDATTTENKSSTNIVGGGVNNDTSSANFDVYGEEIEQDPLGEGPNVVVPPEPMFALPSHNAPKRRKSLYSGLDLITSRPVYARDRCTITLTHGDPDAALDKSGKRMRRYVVLSDLSNESRYAVEWAIGTVARDGDEVFLISVMEAEDKVDPKEWTSKEQQFKLKVQKERQTTAALLVRQVSGLLQRTRLNVTVTCQALHAKNARHMLLDLIDFLEPTMVIVGSRGLGNLKGILLGSTSHYLVQKSSVPVMVARRRLQRPMRKTNPANLRHSPRVKLAAASIEKTPSSKQEDEIVDVEKAEAEAEKAEGGLAKGTST